MKIVLFTISILFLSATAYAQRPQAVTPVRVGLALAEQTADNREFSEQLRGELNKLRDLAVTSSRTDFDVTTVTTRVTARGETIGYCAAVLIMDSRQHFRLSIETGATLPAMAENLARYLDKEFFETKRRGR